MSKSILALFVTLSLGFQILVPTAILITESNRILVALVDGAAEEAQPTSPTCQEEDFKTIHIAMLSSGQNQVRLTYRFRSYLDGTSSHTQSIHLPPPEALI